MQAATPESPSFAPSLQFWQIAPDRRPFDVLICQSQGTAGTAAGSKIPCQNPSWAEGAVARRSAHNPARRTGCSSLAIKSSWALR